MTNYFLDKITLESFKTFMCRSGGLVLIIFLAVLLRVPAIFQELPPYLFCDESMFADEAFAMLQQGRMLTGQFKAGGLNIYIPLLIAKPLFFFNDHIFSYTLFGYTNFVMLGRIAYVLLLNPLTLVFIYFSAVELFQKKTIGLCAALAFLISPFMLANSRMWYPDHYIVFFSAGLFYFLIRHYKAPLHRLNYPFIGIFLALTISTKYTGLLLVPVVGLVLLMNLFWPLNRIQSYTRANWRLILKWLCAAALSSLVVLLVANFSAVVNTPKFILDFNFNVENYRQYGSLGWRGVVFYLFTLYGLSLGGFGVIAIYFGYQGLFKAHPRLILLMLAPIGLATYLGVSGLVLFRNMTIFLPLIFLLAGVGIYRLCVYASAGTRLQKTLSVLVLIGIVFSQLPQIVVTIKRDFATDSRILAEDWLKQNIPTTSSVGTNEFCAGPSPAKVAGLSTQIDPFMKQNLDYYVFDTYWASVFEPIYKGNKGALQIWDQKYLHFYFLNDIDIFRWKTQPTRVESVVPSGYHIVKWFKSNGPDVLILQKQ
jgi:4-amino-4-deoxy-L-arabinose transferase-like glycosyltransferase